VRFWSTLAWVSTCLVLAACGGGSNSSSTQPPPGISVAITPASASVTAGKTQQFAAVVTGSADGSVTWEVDQVTGGNAADGTIDSAGLYKAPSTIPSGGEVTVTAVSQADASATATAKVTVVTSALLPPIPTTFWGIHVNQPASFPLQVPYGEFRAWNGSGAQWPGIETCQAASGDPKDSCFDWTALDSELADLKNGGVQDIFYTLSRTPAWASSNANDPACDYFPLGTPFHGACYPPTDLNADGSGPNLIWKNWVTAIASRVNDANYRGNHSHVKYWEIWNEFSRSTTIESWTGTLSWQGTYNQLVRLAEDARCIITGKGVIHNTPGPGQQTTCTNAAIDSSAVIVAPSHGVTANGLDAIQNFLYCNHNPIGTCSVGDAGAQAVDVINPHLYANDVTPEVIATQNIPALRAVLQPAEQTKPLWNGEGSWGKVPSTGSLWQSDAFARAGFIPRFFAIYWSAGVTGNYWYSYDTNYGELFDNTLGKLVVPEATAWTQTYDWLAGASPAQQPFCQNSGTVVFCDLARTGGYSARLVWDTQYGQNCSQMADPIICGTTSYSVPKQFSKDWIDLSGATHPAGATVTIGANPILLEGQQ